MNVLKVAVAACVLACGAAPALAQTAPPPPAPLQPPKAGIPPKAPGVAMYLTIILILAVVLGAAFIPAKRSHQD